MKIIHDIFPAVVSMTTTVPTPEAQLTAANPATVLNARRLDRARVITTVDRIIVAMDSPEGPLVVFNQLYDQNNTQLASNKSGDSMLVTVPADSSSPVYVAYKRSEDCSCGSRLRGWRPFGNINSVTSTRN